MIVTGTVVHELDLHHRAEACPSRRGTPAPRSASQNALDERLSDLSGRAASEKLGSSSLLTLAIREQRELTDDERLAAGVEQRAVEAAVLVREDAKTRDLRGQACRVVVRVALGDAEQDEQSRPAGAHDLAAHRDGCPGDPLDDSAHRRILSHGTLAVVGVVELTDRDAIAAFCRRRPAVHAYALGDLDDFFWPHTRWLAWEGASGIEQLALLYDEPDPPVLLALAEPPGASMDALLGAIGPELPARVYAHLSRGSSRCCRHGSSRRHRPSSIASSASSIRHA